MSATNRQFKLAARPVGMPKESDFSLVEAPMPAPGEDQVLVKTAYLSVDPYMRGRITGVKSYADPVNIGDVMVGGTVGRVMESKSPNFAAGDYVSGQWGWQENAVADAKTLRKLDPKVAPVSTAL
jgi:NADPH-dependent curcumin reductase